MHSPWLPGATLESWVYLPTTTTSIPLWGVTAPSSKRLWQIFGQPKSDGCVQLRAGRETSGLSAGTLSSGTLQTGQQGPPPSRMTERGREELRGNNNPVPVDFIPCSGALYAVRLVHQWGRVLQGYRMPLIACPAQRGAAHCSRGAAEPPLRFALSFFNLVFGTTLVTTVRSCCRGRGLPAHAGIAKAT